MEMLADDEEILSAWGIVSAVKRDNRDSAYMHWIHAAQQLTGVSKEAVVKATDDFLLIDFLMRNVDRHYNNFGLIRNVETLAVRPAPVYDTGDSLWSGIYRISNDDYKTKPFVPSEKFGGFRQLRMIQNWDQYDLQSLAGWPDDVATVLSENPLIPPQRVKEIDAALTARVELVAQVKDESR